MSDVAPPRLRIRYLLRERGRTLAMAEETLTNLNFLSRYGRGASATSFHYERALIRGWLESRIAGRGPAGG